MGLDPVKLELDLAGFDPLAVPVPRLRPPLRVTTLAELQDTPGNRHRIYELNKACSADIPERGEFFSYAEYVERRFETDTFRADGQILVIDEDTMTGMCAVSYREDRSWAFIEMTGVLPSHRRRGLATLLKVNALTTAQRWGARTVRTINHPANNPILTANRRLGFRVADF